MCGNFFHETAQVHTLRLDKWISNNRLNSNYVDISSLYVAEQVSTMNQLMSDRNPYRPGYLHGIKLLQRRMVCIFARYSDHTNTRVPPITLTISTVKEREQDDNLVARYFQGLQDEQKGGQQIIYANSIQFKNEW